MKKLRGAKISTLPKSKVTRLPKWWIGAMTLLTMVLAGIIMAFFIQAGMNATVDLEPGTLYGIFFSLGIVGMTAGGLFENGGHLPNYHPLYHSGQVVCTITNAVVYAVLVLLWLVYHGDERLKK
jgi:hypothetical protein